MAKSVKKHSFQWSTAARTARPAAGAIVLQAVSSYKETVESNLKVGKFIPVILLLRTVLVLELLTLIAVCFIRILSFIDN